MPFVLWCQHPIEFLKNSKMLLRVLFRLRILMVQCFVWMPCGIHLGEVVVGRCFNNQVVSPIRYRECCRLSIYQSAMTLLAQVVLHFDLIQFLKQNVQLLVRIQSHLFPFQQSLVQQLILPQSLQLYYLANCLAVITMLILIGLETHLHMISWNMHV